MILSPAWLTRSITPRTSLKPRLWIFRKQTSLHNDSRLRPRNHYVLIQLRVRFDSTLTLIHPIVEGLAMNSGCLRCHPVPATCTNGLNDQGVSLRCELALVLIGSPFSGWRGDLNAVDYVEV